MYKLAAAWYRQTVAVRGDQGLLLLPGGCSIHLDFASVSVDIHVYVSY